MTSARPPDLLPTHYRRPSAKRPAVDGLADPRAIKQRRLGDNEESVPAKWKRLFHEVIDLTTETVTYLVYGNKSQSTPVARSSRTPNGRSLPLRATRSVPTRQPIPGQFRQNMDPPPPPPPRRAASLMPPPPVNAARPRHPSAPPTNASSSRKSSAHMPPPPTPTDSSSTVAEPRSSRSMSRGPYPPEMEEVYRQNALRTLAGRTHIFDVQHRAQVVSDRQKDREAMMTEIFKLKRASGYTSNFGVFQGYLSYRQKLERLEQRESILSSRSMSDLHSAYSEGQTTSRTRRHSSSDDLNPEFLERALKNARATLNSPRPPKPFSPAQERIRTKHLALDELIDLRIRPKRPPLPEHLPAEQDAEVRALLRKTGVVSKFAREQVTDKDVQRLHPMQWLNDEIINFYGALMMARSENACKDKAKGGDKENPLPNGFKADAPKPLDVHYFSSFFWSKLITDGYDKGRLAKWTKKVDLFAKDVVLIPVNHSNAHWTAAAINFKEKRIESYDSMNMYQNVVFKHLRGYLDAEHRNKKKKPFDFAGWIDYTPDTPQQENGYDCGVFTCQVLNSVARGEPPNFEQKNIPYLRRRMIWEIGKGQLQS